MTTKKEATMNVLESIKGNIVLSSEGRMINIQTVIKTIAKLVNAGRNVMSVEDVTYVINKNLGNTSITEAKVKVILKKVAKDYSEGVFYNELRGKGKFVAMGNDFFQMGK